MNTSDLRSEKRHSLVLLVDDHTLFRQGLRTVLQQTMQDIAVDEVDNINEALALMRTGRVPDLILLDIHLPGVNGLEGLALLRHVSPCVRIAMVSGQVDLATMNKALERGADGFIGKTAEMSELHQAVSQLLLGARYFPQLEVPELQPWRRRRRLDHSTLTKRQLEILGLMAEGLSNKAIAKKLNVSEHTIRAHVSAVLDHFDCNSRTEAVHIARQQGLLG